MSNSFTKVLKKIIITILFAVAAVCLVGGLFIFIDTFGKFNESTQSFDKFTKMAQRWEGAILLVFTGFVCIVWAILILNISKMKNNIAESKKKVEDTRMCDENEKKVESIEKEAFFCVYCETELMENERTCPNCGASKNKSIKYIEKAKK